MGDWPNVVFQSLAAWPPYYIASELCDISRRRRHVVLAANSAADFPAMPYTLQFEIIVFFFANIDTLLFCNPGVSFCNPGVNFCDPGVKFVKFVKFCNPGVNFWNPVLRGCWRVSSLVPHPYPV